MKSPLVRRLGAVALTTVVLAGTASVAPAQAAPSTPNVYGASAASWLSKQLTGGVVHNDQYDFDDYGLSLDVFFALDALGVQPAAADSIITALRTDPNAYIGTGGATYTGSAAKLATAVELADGNPRAFGGQDLVARIEAGVHAGAGAEQGHATDTPVPAGTDADPDYSSVITQSYVVRALTGAGGSTRTASTVSFLLKQQCAAGFFRAGLTSSDGSFACDTGAAGEKQPDVDSTSFAVQALVDARARGVSGLDDDISDAGAWLASQQAANGSFTGNGIPNSNTTGLAAVALAESGHQPAARKAGAWLTKLQVGDWVAQNHPKLAKEIGAIAYSRAGLTTGEKEGIPTEARDQFRRATAQAAIGVNAVPKLTVSAPTGYLRGGSKATVTVAGLVPGERWTIRIGSRTITHGSASSTGRARTSLRLPRSTRRLAIRAVGSSSARAARGGMTVLGPKTLGLSVAHRSVQRGTTQRVRVKGLRPGEAVHLYYDGRRLANGVATSAGEFLYTFPAGTSLGTKRFVARGQFHDRAVLTTWTVTR